MKQHATDSTTSLHRTYNVIVEGSVFSAKKQSGIAYAVTNMILALAASQKHNFTVLILLPKGAAYVPDVINDLTNVTFKVLPFNVRIMRLLSRFSLTIPLNFFGGLGTYIFPNYFNFTVHGGRSLTFIHDIAFRLYPQTVAPKNLTFLENNIVKWSRRTDRILTLSTASKMEIAHELPIDPAMILIAPVPLFTSQFRPQLLTSVTREHYGIPQRYFLYIGNLEPRKNLARLVTAFAYSKAVDNGIALVLVGADAWGDHETKKAIDFAREKRAIIAFPKSYVTSTDLPQVISGAALVVQPSLHEGLGLPPLQALACGTPVLVSNIAVMRETLGAAASYMSPDSISDMTAAIDTCITGSFPMPPADVVARVLDRFAPERFADLIAEEAKANGGPLS